MCVGPVDGRWLGVVVVTYGNRIAFLEQVLRALSSSADLGVVVVVDNASSVDVGAWLEGLDLPIAHRLIRNPQNTGTAAAFNAALDHLALVRSVTHVLFLDDDTVPAANALEQLRIHVSELGPLDGLVLNRLSRPELRTAILTGHLRNATNSFAGFSIRKQALRLWWHLVHCREHQRKSPVTVEYAAYAGLLIGKSLFSTIGRPRTDYFLYADDYEFTTRITQAGGQLRVLESALLIDLETSWHLKRRLRFVPAADVRSDPLRTYYSLRNRISFEREYLTSSQLERDTNELCFWAGVVSGLLIQRLRGASNAEVLERWRLLRRASADGKGGRLGPRYQLMPGGPRDNILKYD
jgi:GT2 family glycosyltransferase